ncbi:hypothetical protein [Cupriavidus pauculus]|uniref:hypothetical protein n=1 Tax=Cupriavidus pauculus TaxID=82633 RepID=UPI001EE316FF|nr:hypothetical protein [Cupriavidus pauculus]GJG93648.1 hypothetical protein CBA19C6_04185 [Cupriavidus pauculus]
MLTDAGNDSFTMSAGSTNGIVDLAGGSNSITLTGGTIGSGLRTSAGPANTLLWQDGGIITGPVTLNGDDNQATLRRLTDANLAELTALQSGAGTGTLTFDATTAGNASRFTNWTIVNLTNGSRLTLDKPGLVLRNAGTGTGTLNIDTASALLAGGLGVQRRNRGSADRARHLCLGAQQWPSRPFRRIRGLRTREWRRGRLRTRLSRIRGGTPRRQRVQPGRVLDARRSH